MTATISGVRGSNPDSVTAAAGALGKSVAEVQTQIHSQQGLLSGVRQSWAGRASTAAVGRGSGLMQSQIAFRNRLDVVRRALSAGGRQLSALRAHILSLSSQASVLGGIVDDDGTVRPSGTGQMMTPTLAKAYTVVLQRLLAAFDSVDAATASAVRGAGSSATVQAVGFGVGGDAPQGPPGLGSAVGEKRQNEIDAFKEVFSREPTSETDWETAAALDPHSYDEKYQGVPPSIVVGKIEPVPGQGVVKSGLFIPRDEVFNVPRNDLGDNRGFDPNFAPEDTRVSLYVDYENGVVIARQNPSVDDAGSVEVATPRVKVQQAPDGAVRIQYDAKNAFAPPGADLSGHMVRGDVVLTPGISGQPAAVDGLIGDYPSLEVYQNMPDGTTHTIVQDAADSGNSLGPLTELPFSHEIGRGAAAFEPFESYAPQLPGGPRFPGDTVPYVPGQVDPNTPTNLGPTNDIPRVVVVR